MSNIITPPGCKIYEHRESFPLEQGDCLRGLKIAYNTFGTLSPEKDNVVWVCHGLTANSDVSDWWPGTVQEGRFLDPSKFFIVCANFLGSPYGTSGPNHLNPATDALYLDEFPKFTIRDMVRAHRLLAEHLGLDRIHTLIGVSVGGFQALEWAIEVPDMIERLILMATDSSASPWSIALDESQRMAIKADSSWGERHLDAARKGLAAARAIALLSYRGSFGYNLTQRDVEEMPEIRRAVSYQRYQGEKLCRRFDAYSYVAILDSFDTHNVGRGRGGVESALSRVKARTLVAGITTDILFPSCEVRDLANKIPGAVYSEIESQFGHDGFLVENEALNDLFYPFINDEN